MPIRKGETAADWSRNGMQATLEAHAAAGHFAREAAAELGVSSRAVISRAWRTGVTFTPDRDRLREIARRAGRASAAKRAAR